MKPASQYWFPAKRYGWGWGIPTAWQGWTVLVLFFVLLGLGTVLFPPTASVLPFLLYSTTLAAILVAICYLKGEPPAWHWGKR
ncbi:MAG: hypothetical protein V4858_22460 [Pseudomonadota bacterium]